LFAVLTNISLIKLYLQKS